MKTVCFNPKSEEFQNIVKASGLSFFQVHFLLSNYWQNKEQLGSVLPEREVLQNLIRSGYKEFKKSTMPLTVIEALNSLYPTPIQAAPVEVQVAESPMETTSQTPTAKGKMTFSYGKYKREGIISNTTFDAIKNGERTATTRYESDGNINYWRNLKVGDTIEFESSKGEKLLVEVTKPLHKLSGSGKTPKQWSMLEGWSTEYFDFYVRPKMDEAWQIEFKYIPLAKNSVSRANQNSDLPKLFNKQDKELKKGSVVEYNGKKYLFWNNNNGKAQLINTDGTKFSGTPNIDKLTILGSYKTVLYNNIEYIVTDNDNIYSGATGNLVYTGTDNSSQTQKNSILALAKNSVSNSNPNSKTSDSSNNTINIFAGTNENADLSNFANRPFSYDGFTYNSVEQAFQHAKWVRFGIPFGIRNNSGLGIVKQSEVKEAINEQINKIMSAKTGAEAKKLGGDRTIIPTSHSKQLLIDWDSNSLRIMKELITASFEQNPTALQRLLSTGNAELTHKFRGVEQDGGRFSKLLMEVRNELRDKYQQKTGISQERQQQIEELFEDNQELANAVYEAAGLNNNNFELKENKKAFGKEPHPEGANSYDIFFNGRKIGKIALFDGKNIMIKGVNLNESERNKGLGKALYKWLNYKAILKGGRLYGDQEFISPDAQRVWESLNKEGFIDLTGNSPKFNDKQKQQAIELYSQYLEQGGSQEDIEGFKKFVSKQTLKEGVSELFESNPELANEVYKTLGFNNYELTMDSFMPKKHWKIGHIIDNPTEAANICDNTQIRVLNYILDKFGKPKEKGTFYAKPVTIWAKSPINDKQIHHYTVAVRVNNKVYLYDMPQSEYIEYVSENKGKVIKEYKPRLIEYTPTNLQFYYGTSNENLHIQDEVILTSDLINLNQLTSQQKQQAVELYSHYLDTIFPDSIVKYIVYRGDENYNMEGKILSRVGGNKYTNGIYFAKSKREATGYINDAKKKFTHVFSAILNLKNPKVTDIYDKEINTNALTENEIDSLKSKNIDGLDIGLSGEQGFEYVVFEPEQIHILGSKKDIEGFKKYVNSSKLSNMSSLGKLQGDLMESEKGQIGVNKQQLLMLLGPTMYNKPLAQVAVKELLQNSFDAIKARMNVTDNKQTGNIEITVNYDDRTIAIKDDGIGMTPDIVKNAFLSIGGTNKEGLDVSERSGGFGLAKVQFLLGSEYVKVTTVRDGVKTSLEATAVQLYNDDFIINKEKTDEPNGSYVEVKIPKSYITPEGSERMIDFPGKYASNLEKYKAFDILTKPLIGDVNVTFNHVSNGTNYSEVIPIGVNINEDMLPPLFSKIEFAWGTADLYMSIDKNTNPKHRILSSGIFQFTHAFRNKEWAALPYDIVVNIKPSVSSTAEQYPFNNQREGFKNTVSRDIESLTMYLRKYAKGEAEKEAKAVFSNITGLPKVDPNKVLSSEERQKLYADVERTIELNTQRESSKKSGYFDEELRKVFKLVIDENGVRNAETGKQENSMEKTYESSFAPEKEIEKVDAVETSHFNPALPQYHNNTNVDYLAIPGAVEFFSDFGSVVLDMVRFVGNNLGYEYNKLASKDDKFFVGVSIDRQYGGVHVRNIINAIFVNPLAFDVSSLEEAVGIALHITIHEINHTTVSGEGAGFTTALGILYGKIYGTGKYSLYEGLFRSVFKKHFETFKQLKNEYDKSSTRNLSESFKGSEIKTGTPGNVQGYVTDVQTGETSSEGYTGDRESNTKDKTGDVILSNYDKLSQYFVGDRQGDNIKIQDSPIFVVDSSIIETALGNVIESNGEAKKYNDNLKECM